MISSDELDRFRFRARNGRLDATVGDWLDLRLGADWRLPALDVRWRTIVGILDSFVDEFGHASVPKNHMQGGLNLGSWVSGRREDWRTGTLAPDRVAELESRPGWTWDPDASAWMVALAALDSFIARESHARVGRVAKENGINLGSWVGNQRNAYRAGTMSPDRVAELESRPGWSWDALVDAWEAALAALDLFIAHESHARVEGSVKVGDFNLGSWVSTQRRSYRAGTMSPDRVAELESRLGWSWDLHADALVTALAALDSFIARESHARVPAGLKENGFNLGFWVASRRTKYRAGTLAAERIAELESRRGWTWDALVGAWETALAALDSFIARESHARVKQRSEENGFNLGSWVARQRKSYWAGTLSPARIAELESRPGWAWSYR